MVKIKDIAEKAGVAISTVSKALTNKNYVSEDLKKKIFDACRELNYKPNYIAQMMTKKHTGLIGFFFDTTHETFGALYPPLIKGLCTTVAEHDSTLVLYWDLHKTADKQFARNGLIDGAIILGPFDDDYRIREFSNDGTPFVIIGKVPKQFDPSLPHVDNDNEGAIYEVTERLLRYGHRKICFISGQESLTICQDRYRGFRRAFEKAGLEFDDSAVYNLNDLTAAESERILFENLGKGYTACVTESDQTAFGAYSFAARTGKRIGADFAVASLGGFVENNLSPGLTTVRVDVEQVGRAAAERLFSLLKGEPCANCEDLPCTINYNGSTEFKLHN